MKKILVILTLGIFIMGFAFASNGEQARDGTGEYHDEVVASGGQEGNPDAELMQERQESAMQARNQISAGEYRVEGRPIRIEQKENNRVRIRTNSVSADTSLELQVETTGSQTNFKTKLSNGRNANIKIMPNVASETALQRLRLRVCSEENNCSIELKEVGSGEQVRAAYEVRAKKRARLFGFIPTDMPVESQVDAETGELIQTRRPWWSFLASEEDEIEDTEESE